MAIGDEERAKCTKAFQRFLTVLLGGVLLNGHVGLVRLASIASSHALRLPNEVLKQIAAVLGEEHNLRLLDDITAVGNKLLAVRRELFGRLAQWTPLQRRVHRDIDLLVLLER